MLRLVKLELLKTFRNRRFLIFTIIIPVLFFIGLKRSTRNINNFSVDYLFYICIMYGMLGNNLVTMSTKIAREKDFLLGVFKTTKLDIVKNTVVQFLTQGVLNALIALILMLVGYFFLGLSLTITMLFDSLLVYLFCNIFVFVGSLLGYFFDPVTLQVISNPIYIGVIMLSMPGALIRMFPKMFQKVYSVFPGHYLWKLIAQININEFSLKDFILFTSYMVAIVGMASVFLYARQTKAAARS